MQSRLLERRTCQYFSQQRSSGLQTRRRSGGSVQRHPSPSALPLKGNFLSPPLRALETLSPARINKLKAVVEAPVFRATRLPPVYRISDSEKTEYKAEVPNAYSPAHGAHRNGLDHVEKLPNTVGESRRVNVYGSFSMAEKNPLSDRLSVSFLAGKGKLVIPVYLVEGFHRRAVSETVNGFGIDEAGFPKQPLVQL